MLSNWDCFVLIVLFRADVLRTCLVGCCFLFGARLFIRIVARGKGVVCAKSRQVHIAAWQGRRSAEGCAVRTVLFLIVLFHAGVLRMCLVGCCLLFGDRLFVARALPLEMAKGSYVGSCVGPQRRPASKEGLSSGRFYS